MLVWGASLREASDWCGVSRSMAARVSAREPWVAAAESWDEVMDLWEVAVERWDEVMERWEAAWESCEEVVERWEAAWEEGGMVAVARGGCCS